MTAWWTGLNGRERLMICIAGGLAIFVGLYQFVVLPVFDARSAAGASYQREAANFQTVQNGLSVLSKKTDADRTVPTASNEALEVLLSRTSKDHNIEILRLQPSANDGRLIVFEQVQPGNMHSWMLELETTYGLQIVAFELRKRDGTEAIRGNLTVRDGAAS